ncbi:phosphotransferase enzyme family protein [Jackrogersella minutella]|nr:phosphotransferase enzyme family protein [Jackrogersella minutella]
MTKEELAEATGAGRFCCVYRLTDNRTIAKSGQTTRLASAEAMKFVREHTQIPVPQVYNAYVDKESGRVRIVMEYIEGERLDHAWEKLTSEGKESVIGQLRDHFTEPRKITGSFIGHVDGPSCEDPNLLLGDRTYGPYSDEESFNQGLVKAWTADRDDMCTFKLCEVLCATMKNHKIVLTHNDLDPRIILVRGSEVVAVLDWEQSGFYPEHWDGWMRDRLMDRILEPYYNAFAVMWHTSYTMWCMLNLTEGMVTRLFL